ncbi:hypothetical protein MTF64_04680 [Pseudoalteromonas sp. 2CM41L]|uniref:hypothetical protein n=1 Tax=Pseudoalteromonas sp. 2CM41L TaxID=2929857 RepID=UPI0020BDD807|nr:hypothetical protein [Pseudoalteromonas sp. 2CM41L]MCK8106166.1 hypothetical protein [Pseudoalteromonas sp. 2CM41L]
MDKYTYWQNLIETDWQRSNLGIFALNFLESVFTKEISKDIHLTYPLVKKYCKCDMSSVEITELSQYFCGARVPLLTMHFEYILEDYCIDLDEENTKSAIEDNEIEIPDSGELISDVRDHIYIYFKLSNFAVKEADI